MISEQKNKKPNEKDPKIYIRHFFEEEEEERLKWLFSNSLVINSYIRSRSIIKI